MKKLDETKLPAPATLDNAMLESPTNVTDGQGETIDAEAHSEQGEVYSQAQKRSNAVWLKPYHFNSETARNAALLRHDNRLDRQVTKALAQHYSADKVVSLFDEGFELARSRQSPKAFVEALSLLMGYLVGEPLKRQVTATTTLEDMMSRYLKPSGEADDTPPGGEGMS